MGLSKEHIKERIGSSLEHPYHGELAVGTMEQFRKGVGDFHQWASGVISGPRPWLIDRLATIMSSLSLKTLDIDRARNYDWQESDLEGFCYRIQALLPDGTLAGYYLGRIDSDTYAVFGYGIMVDEVASPSSSHAEAPSSRSSGMANPARESSDFYSLLMDMMCCIMCADANMSKQEIGTACRILKELHVPWGRGEVERRLKEFVQRVRSEGLLCVIEQTLDRLRDFGCLDRSKLMLDSIDRIVHADGRVDPRAMNVRQKFVDAFRSVPEKPQDFSIDTEVGSWAQDDRLHRVERPVPRARSTLERKPSQARPGASRGSIPTAREIVDRRVAMAREFVLPQSRSKRDQVLEVMDRCLIDPDKMFTCLKQIGTRAEVLHMVNEIERDLEAGRLDRSYIVISAAAKTIRQYSHLL